jgi:hypothetical protein
MSGLCRPFAVEDVPGPVPATSSARAGPRKAKIPQCPTPAPQRCSCICCNCLVDCPNYHLQSLHGPIRAAELPLATGARPFPGGRPASYNGCKTLSGRRNCLLQRLQDPLGGGNPWNSAVCEASRLRTLPRRAPCLLSAVRDWSDARAVPVFSSKAARRRRRSLDGGRPRRRGRPFRHETGRRQAGQERDLGD